MSDAGLSADQRKFYEENGYILVKGVFTRASKPLNFAPKRML